MGDALHALWLSNMRLTRRGIRRDHQYEMHNVCAFSAKRFAIASPKAAASTRPGVNSRFSFRGVSS